MNEQLFKDIVTSAQVSSALLAIAFLLVYIAFFKKGSSDRPSPRR